MLYGHWEPNQDLTSMRRRLERINLQATPPVPDRGKREGRIARQGFEVIGYLSEMYSTYYNLMTLTETGEVQQLRHEPDPGVLADLIPSDYWSSPSRDLPIWKLITRPSVGPSASSNVAGS